MQSGERLKLSTTRVIQQEEYGNNIAYLLARADAIRASIRWAFCRQKKK